jgi:uncharacterized membrane protein
MAPDAIATAVSSYVGMFVVVVAIAVTVYLYIRAKFRSGTQAQDSQLASDAISNLQATVGALQTQNTLQAAQIKDQADQVAKLTGKVDTLSTVPLAKIEKHMADTNQILQALLPLIPKSIERVVTEQTTTKL